MHLTHLMNNNKIQEYSLVIELENRQLLNLSLNKHVTLSPSECLILKHLMDNCSQTIGREFLLEHCWPGRVVTSSSLNVAIKNVRTALKAVGSECKVVTVQKEGYCFISPDKGEAQVTELINNPSEVAPERLEINSAPKVVKDPTEVSDVIEMPFSKRQSLLNLVNGKNKLYVVPLAAGIAVSALLVVVLSFLGFFMEKTSINGIVVYHDSVNLDSMLVEDLTSIAEPGVEAIYLHRMGVDCGAIQVVILNQSGWKDISSSFKLTHCNDTQVGLYEIEPINRLGINQTTEGTVDEA
ncbi:transcriptional regulator [Vibrio lentus]|uniref:Transcriptional regulator n=2 Tax=Vibrio lentus TaxID=136468 RepID=A0AB36XUU0_9VIBR|nr:winged helix-turn-helix domain-containing protein [Vibrio lentus]MCC4838735.1 winged helix-turn-helix domain-containing protein [Vibrio lentus]PMI16758.1 transcriptional regulator [Vibrio lentus]PMK36717.1 transcriptional regulator [Vibrio lentus]PMK50298.1 transcriptional regulator [Vibrio lentus]PML27998.1 transcriptional regulator [Vibrio lentus]